MVLVFYFSTGGTSLYDAGRTLLIVGIALTVLVFPLFHRSHHRARIRIHLHLPVEERNRIVADPYYDVFAGVALATILIAALGYGIITIANTLEGRQPSNTNLPFIGSVKSELPHLYETAYQWQSDAYLVELEYNFGWKEAHSDYLINADFRSFAEPNTILEVEVTPDGNYVYEFYHLPQSASMSLSITEENWVIDSQEAISIFAQDNDEIRACLSFDRPKKLKLTRRYSAEQEVKWCLFIDECSEIPQKICIDAETGEEIPIE
jgi:hypothetical protein